MKSFKELEISNFDSIQSSLVPYVLKKYPRRFRFWNHVDQTDLFCAVPELKSTIADVVGQEPVKTYLFVIPRAPAFILAYKLGAKTIHRDTGDETARFNWPVLNASSIETRFFKSSVEPNITTRADSGETWSYQESDCELIDRFCMTRPAVLHVHTIHGLYRAVGPLPRYVLSFKFEQPIDHLLK
jgi:hypothetical protein